MAKKAQPKEDAFADLDGPDSPPVKKAPAKQAASKSTKVAFEFPEGTSPEVMEKVMAQMARLTADQTKAQDGIDAGRAQYIAECKTRYRCMVNSLRPGWDSFELTISHPVTDAPIVVRGRCGVILEDGLTKYAIDCLRQSHDFRIEAGRSMTIEQILAADSAMVLDTKQVKQPHYSVEVYGEVENPKPVGTKIG